MMALPQSAIFSPTAARLAASTAKDWNTVDSWLQRHFHHHSSSIPKFERNPDTLKALLALSSLNEAADEDRDLICAVEKEALHAIKDHRTRRNQTPSRSETTTTTTTQQEGGGEGEEDTNPKKEEEEEHEPIHPETIRSEILELLEASLPREGQTALSSLAKLTITLDAPPPPPPSPPSSDDNNNTSPLVLLSVRLASLQASIHLLEQQSVRLSTLSSYLSIETDRAKTLLKDLHQPLSSDDDNNHDDDDHRHHTHYPPQQAQEARAREGEGEGEDESTTINPYMPASHLARQNLETQRLVKNLTDVLSSSSPPPPSSTRHHHRHHHSHHSHPSFSSVLLPLHPSISQLGVLEDSYKDLLATKRALDVQVGLFEGLPTDLDAAKQELDRRRRELARITVKRDVVFEGLVERESPVKRRR